jgi:NADPH:quinone reductase-like Zn-dependent oxidoreductase
MLAYVLSRYGRPEGSLLMEVPAPRLRSRDILVDVRVAGLNPVDFKFRQGKLRAIYRPRLPLVLGTEFAGEVVAVGGEVKRFSVGDRVFARRRIGLAPPQSGRPSVKTALPTCRRTWISKQRRAYPLRH